MRTTPSDGLQAAWDGTEEVEAAQGICAADVGREQQEIQGRSTVAG